MKKNKEEFIPSKYQLDIFNFIKNEKGNLVVQASAGSGKTTTLIKCLDYIPNDNKVLISAFNKAIAKELSKRTSKLSNVDVKTLHSLGLSIIRMNFPQVGGMPDLYKYDNIIKTNLRKLSRLNTYRLKREEYQRYIANIKKYVDFGRMYLCSTPKDLDFIENRYDIDTIGDEKDIAISVMEIGKEALESIDYYDMVWLPNVLNLDVMGMTYDFIFLDECQDVNKAERELIFKCFKENTRLISVGDENQCIYSFSGADPDSFNVLKSLPNTKMLPLSISYRCGKNIVDLAKSIVPTIEAADDAINGVVSRDVQLDEISDGDMILCRNNAPLVQIYNEYLKSGKKAFIMGKDIGKNLKTAVENTNQRKLNVDCRQDGVFARLYYDLFTTRDKLMDRMMIDEDTAIASQQVQSKLDIIKALEVLSEGVNTATELISKINAIFSDSNKNEGVSLSTIHKAKGLEADNVYIACESLMPSKSAKKDWEIRQEMNLIYVAYTRAKKTLGFIDESDFGDFNSQNSKAALKRIENLINNIFGRTNKIVVDNTNAKKIVSRAEIIDINTFRGNSVNLSGSQNKRKVNTFSDLLKNKRK